MTTTFLVTENFECTNLDPICLKRGDKVLLGEKSNDNGAWANWIYCTSKRTQKCGWTPIQILNINGDTATANSDYTATEMTVIKGERVIGYKELNGWIWCARESDGKKGWVPQNCLMLEKKD